MTVSQQDTLVYTRNTVVMVKSGIPLLEAVRSQASNAQNPSFRRVLVRMAADIEAGQRFSVALSRFPSVFPSFYVNAVKAGETAGTLEQNLEYVASQIEAGIAFRKALSSALLYPLVLGAALLVVGFTVGTIVLPTLSDMLLSLGGEPPPLTKVILGIGALFDAYGWVIAACAVLLCLAVYLFFQGRGGKKVFDRLILHMPVLGSIFRQVSLSETAVTLSTLLKSGVPVHESLKIAADSLRSDVYRQALLKVVPPVLKGNPISVFLDRKLFPPLFVQMMEVGEKSAHIEQNLDFLAEFYRKETERSLKNILTLLEPILLIIVGIAVLLLALALLGPIYQIAGGN